MNPENVYVFDVVAGSDRNTWLVKADSVEKAEDRIKDEFPADLNRLDLYEEGTLETFLDRVEQEGVTMITT